MNEFELIRKIKKMIPRASQGLIGIGDDADLLRGNKSLRIICADSISEDIDFLYGETRPEAAGRKLLAVNLSDMAAMAGVPEAYILTLGIPSKIEAPWIIRFYRGLLTLASKYRLKCLGGDFSGADSFWASLTLIGRPGKKILRRSGAKPGDWIGVTGSFGGSILGKHLKFEPRLKEAALIGEAARSMIDVSDGLAQDLGHLLEASKVGAEIELGSIPIAHAAQKLSKKSWEKALVHALSDGEDFELLFTVSEGSRARLDRAWRRRFRKIPLSWIGRITSRRGKTEWLLDGRNIRFKLSKKGYTHF